MRLQSVADGWARDWLWKGEAEVRVERETGHGRKARWTGARRARLVNSRLPCACRQAGVRLQGPLLTGIAADEGESREIESALGEAVLEALEARLAGEAEETMVAGTGKIRRSTSPGRLSGRLSAEIVISGTVARDGGLGARAGGPLD
ncbi:MAG: hypothetical protein MZV65_40715 [Chromatiales bacterium]|nr:hypothetical protein [Chromatiales bacterium]